MAQITRFDNASNPGVRLFWDDVALEMSIATRDDTGAQQQVIVLTSQISQSAVDLARNSIAGQIPIAPDVGLIWVMAPDNSSIFTVQKGLDTPQQVVLTPAQTNVITAWLVADQPNVSRGASG